MLDEDAKALIWTMSEEGQSQRGIAAELGIAPSTVGKELAADPVRLEALRARLREQRSERWKKLEIESIDVAIDGVAKLKTKISKGKLDAHELARSLSSLTRSGEAGAKMTQLLTGGATDRLALGGSGQSELGDMTNEQLIEAYIELGRVKDLPPMLRALAEKEIKRRGREPSPKV
jgi:predicted transcriptional regulator